MKRFIYAMSAAAAIVLCATGCSDNDNDIYEPVKTPLKLEVKADSTIFNQDTHQLTLSANGSVTEMEVTSNTRWVAEVTTYETSPNGILQEGWCSLSVNNSIGNGILKLNVTENLLDTRKCTITLYGVNAEGNKLNGDNAISTSFTIVQNYSNVRIAPSEVESFAASNPKSKTFDVWVSEESVEWTLSLSYETEDTPQFMTILPGGNMEYDSSTDTYKGKGNSNFTLSLQTNRIQAARMGFIILKSDHSTYNVEIKQLGSQYTFDVTTPDGTTINSEGGVLKFEVFSPHLSWQISGVPEWLSTSVESGTANETRQPVEIVALPNTANQPRYATIIFEPTGENADQCTPISLQITQAGLEYVFDVTRNNYNNISANGGAVEFTVESPQKNWEIEGAESLPEWIHFSAIRGNSGTQTVTATLDPNISTQDRHIEVNFKTTGDNSDFYRSHRFDIYQNAFSYLKFNVSPFGPLDVFDIFGESRTLSINSDFNWTIEELPEDGWIKISSYDGSPTSTSIRIDVEQNTDGAPRSSALLFVPLPTSFRGYDNESFTVNPEDLGVQPVQVNITQYGGLSKEPAISVPWLAEGYSQTEATVEFNYYSPFHNIVSAGIQWKLYDENDTNDDNWNTLEDEDFFNNGADGYVSVEINDLKAATRYVARGYVVYSNNQVKYGDVSYPFTTAGVRPGGDDIITPHN